MASEHSPQLDADQTTLPSHAAATAPRLLAGAAAALLVAGIGAALSEHGLRRFMLAYLVAYAFVLSLSLGSLFFVLLQHLTHAGWSVLVRRPAELLAANMPVLAVLFAPIAISVALGHGEIYPWAQPAPRHAVVGHGGADHAASTDIDDSHAPAGSVHAQLDDLTLKKRPYLTQTFFLLRWVGFLTIWSAIALAYLRGSLNQGRGVAVTMRLEKWAGPLLVVYGLTVTFAAWDLLMSIDPHWYSTIFGVYYFSGAVVGAMAMLILCLLWLRSRGVLSTAVNKEHYHDLGKLLFAFVVFWAYIAFSQYMLIWYANMPETTGWFRIRGFTSVPGDVNAWTWIGVSVFIGHFVLPFLGLMSRLPKRRPAVLGLWAAWLLVMHYLDLLWLVMPQFGPGLALGPIEIGLALALAGVCLAAALHRSKSMPLAPVDDPRLDESLSFANF